MVAIERGCLYLENKIPNEEFDDDIDLTLNSKDQISENDYDDIDVTLQILYHRDVDEEDLGMPDSKDQISNHNDDGLNLTSISDNRDYDEEDLDLTDNFGNHCDHTVIVDMTVIECICQESLCNSDLVFGDNNVTASGIGHLEQHGIGVVLVSTYLVNRIL